MNEVSKWLISGAEVNEGLRLLSIYAPNPHLSRLVQLQPIRYKFLLEKKLSGFADIRLQTQKRKGFREEWKFLSEPDCPAELKILASDKITAYHNYVDGHEALFACTSIEDCYKAAKKVIENYRQNRIISSEFAYWSEHHSLLAKHPIFAARKRLADLRKLGIVGLVRKQKNLIGAIWRINSEIKKGDKPHLVEERERRLKEKQSELAEVERMIAEYENK